MLVPASLSTEFVLGQPVEGVQERRPLNSLAELYHAFTLRAVTGNVTMSASKSFGCLFESLSFHSFLLSNAFKVRPIGLMPILNYKAYSFLVVSTHKNRLSRFQKVLKKLVKSSFLELRLDTIFAEPKTARQSVFLGGLT